METDISAGGAQARKKMTPLVADGLLLFVALLWGGGFVVTKYALASVGVGQLLVIRFAVAFLGMLVLCRRRLKAIARRTIFGGCVMGVFLTLGFLFQTYGMVDTGAGKAAFITGLNIVIVPFLAWFFTRQVPHKSALFAVLIALLGMALLTLDFSQKLSISRGDGTVFLCSVFFAGHIVSTGAFADKEDPLLLTLVQFGFALIAAAAFTQVKEGLFPMHFSREGLLACLYLGAFPTCVAFLLQTIGQRYTSPTHASLILVMESVFGCLLGVLILGEYLSLQMWIGCALILAGIVTSEVFRPKAG